MNESEILKYMSETGALLDGHFLLRSGLHSDQYFQAALLLQYADIASRLCAEMAKPWAGEQIDVVLSPAIGGIVVGQEVAKALQTRAIFAEKDDQSNLILRRGFTLKPGERVLVAEDVVTKGGRVQQTIDLARSYGAIPVGVFPGWRHGRGEAASPFLLLARGHAQSDISPHNISLACFSIGL